MTIIFADKHIEGVYGVYHNPKFYAGVPPEAKVVYTNSELIATDARKRGAEVLPLNSDKKSKKLELEVNATAEVVKADEPIGNVVKPLEPVTKEVVEEKELTPAEKRKLTMAKKKKEAKKDN